MKRDTVCAQIRASLDWIHIERIGNTTDRKIYSTRLHAGDVEVMILAREIPRADLVIIDDNTAKKTAKYLGLTVTGTIGVLMEAKEQGIITSIASYIEGLKKMVFLSTIKLFKWHLGQWMRCKAIQIKKEKGNSFPNYI